MFVNRYTAIYIVVVYNSFAERAAARYLYDYLQRS